MNFWFSLSAAAPALSLLAVGLIPGSWAHRHVRTMRPLTLRLAAAAFFLSLAAAGGLVSAGTLNAVYLEISRPLPLTLGVFVDSVAAIMLVLVSFIGLIIARYSLRYLDGDPAQGMFLKWFSFTVGAALLLVVSRNLVMFTVAWMLASFGLHRLLTLYPDRAWAVWAARKKFLISRLGDVSLLGALILTYWHFGTSEYVEIFAAARAIHDQPTSITPLLGLIGILYVVAAMTKSAQVPFHSWLPDTMETPTPVSALMHAGIINAGGFLVIRLSPLVSLSHLALDLLAAVGAFTALFGGLVMLTQSSIKRSLAYSTIAQMGFMLLQCGLGAFSAALLHIVAHSAYKAHAFLSTGSVLESAAQVRNAATGSRSAADRMALLPFSIVAAAGICLAGIRLAGIDESGKPGAVVLGTIMTVALTQLVLSSLSTGSLRLAIRGLLQAGLLCGGYMAAYRLIDGLVAGSTARHVIAPSTFDTTINVLIVLGFIGVFALQAAIGRRAASCWFRSLYVHAMNGFYLDVPARRITAWFWGVAAPVP